jgi:hypothetical protein
MSLIITHDCGFFSCCSVKLNNIVDYINKNKNLPYKVDGSRQFTIYKPNLENDITYDFFEIPNDSEYIYTKNITYHESNVIYFYSTLEFENIVRIIKIYFEPSLRIKTVADNFLNQYDFCYENCIALYYRRTDKVTETVVDSFENFHNKLNELLTIVNNENIKVLIQTDTAGFRDYITTKYTNTNKLIIINELTPSYTNKGTHNERTGQQNYNDITNLLSIVLIISKCKYIICTSGNVTNWILLYRGNSKNVYQNLNCKWL